MTKERPRTGRPAERALYRLEDLAELAGVSISTVSRALNDSDLVSDRTKKKIRTLAQSHNYAGRLRRKLYGAEQTRIISVVIPPPQGRDRRISDPFLLDLIGGLADALIERDCDLLISHTMPSDYDGVARLVASERTDGFVFLGQSTLHDHLNALAAQGAAFVVWGAQLPNQKYCSVGSDNLRGGHRATSHLIRLGRRRIAFVGDTDAPEVRLRFQGYKNALADAGIAFDPELVRPTNFFIESAMETVEALIEGAVSFDGVFGASDLIALGAIRGLANNGLAVPADVSVVGYDDIHMAAYSSPALTTVRQDVAKAGRMLLGKLVRMLDGEKVRSELLPTELIVRESCGG